MLFLCCSFAYYGRSSQVFYDTTLRSDSEFTLRFALAATVQKIAYRSTCPLAYERPVPWGWASLDMALHIVARLMSFVIALHAH